MGAGPDDLPAFKDGLADYASMLAVPMEIVARTSGSIRSTFTGIIGAVEVASFKLQHYPTAEFLGRNTSA